MFIFGLNTVTNSLENRMNGAQVGFSKYVLGRLGLVQHDQMLPYTKLSKILLPASKLFLLKLCFP